jgi:hypothetical protein
MTYVSSIINNYGDPQRVREDVSTLRLILASQGSRLLTDVIAEVCGETANKFKMSPQERNNVMNRVLSEMQDALSERL